MTREELRDYVDEQRTLDNIPYHVYSALIDGIDTLEQEPRWIPVSEKMPLIPQRVLVSTTNGEVFIARYHSIDKWTFELTGISYAYNKDSVVAWMPLPEFFKESEDKE